MAFTGDGVSESQNRDCTERSASIDLVVSLRKGEDGNEEERWECPDRGSSPAASWGVPRRPVLLALLDALFSMFIHKQIKAISGTRGERP